MIIDISVTTSSGRQAFLLDKSGILKCYLKSAPEHGKANDEIIEILVKKLKIAKNLINIISGRTSRKKKVKIDIDLEYQDLLKIIL
ncbi:MAG: hypothetical protein SZ59_C0003G0084 [candidate division TM6 bacterium GW2011_GWF2_28_16]|nr:MAG: hypothetical protein SZ59_C0003G0084 [candidate division TM6 bacterium GW2011_GWF2_28_16]